MSITPSLLQYGRTAGVIGDLVAQQLRVDEGVPASPERVIMTSGCQEALALCVPALCPDRGDVALTCNPTYIGFTCAAQTNNIEVSALPNKVAGVAQAIERSVIQLRRTGRRARLLYLIPNFDNPTGRVLSANERIDILAVCARLKIVVLEDNAYGMFRYDGEAVPSMSALDREGCVIHLSTFSKTIAPAVRVGSVVMPESLFGDVVARKLLTHQLVQRKSFLTLNTSQITQAIVGGLLLQGKSSLREWIQPAVKFYRNNRDLMLTRLEEVFGPTGNLTCWNRPLGGFFLVMNVPFRFDSEAVTDCATRSGVIVAPMSLFALDRSQDRRIRLAFSSAEPDQICLGVERLGQFIHTWTGPAMKYQKTTNIS